MVTSVKYQRVINALTTNYGILGPVRHFQILETFFALTHTHKTHTHTHTQNNNNNNMLALYGIVIVIIGIACANDNNTIIAFDCYNCRIEQHTVPQNAPVGSVIFRVYIHPKISVDALVFYQKQQRIAVRGYPYKIS